MKALLRLLELVRNIRFLGLGLGWRYWRIQAMALKDPGLVLKWARNWRILHPEPDEQWIADALEKSYAAHLALQRK